MRSVEVEGGSIDEAIERALQALGAVRDQVEIDILENATRGLFGFGKTRARVRATMRAPLVLAREADDLIVPAGEHAGTSALTAAPADSGAAVTTSVAAVDRRGRPRPESTSEGVAKTVDRFDGAALLAEILLRTGFPASVRCVEEGGVSRLEIESADPRVIAACGDEMVAALEFLVNRIAERQAKEKVRFTVVIAGRRPVEDPRALARRLAERARARGKAVTVQGLNEEERRAVLEALRTERGISVRTSGGAQPKVIVLPQVRRHHRTTDR